MNLFVSIGLLILTLFCIGLMIDGFGRIFLQTRVDKEKTHAPLTTLVVVLGWLALITALSVSGVLSNFKARPPRFILIPLTALIALVILNRAKSMSSLLQNTPRHWPIAMQTFRIFVELAFWGFFLAGQAPIQVTFEGRNFDVLVGLTAPFMALATKKMNLTPSVVILWNICGLLILGNTIATVLSSIPGPLHHDWPGEPFTQLATWPMIWIPGFLAPLAIFLHVFSIRQNLILSRRGRLLS